MEATLFNIQHFSTHDGPGIRTVVFFKGCPLDCPWCHNPEGKRFEPELAYDSALCAACGRCVRVCPAGAHTLSDLNRSGDAPLSSAHRFDRTRCTGCGRCAESCPTGALERIGRRYTIGEIVSELERDALFFGADGGVTLSGGEPLAQPQAALSLLDACAQRGWKVCVETSGYVDAEGIRAAAAYTQQFLWDCKETDASLHRQYTGVSPDKILQNLSLLDELHAHAVLRCPILPGLNDRPEHFEALAQLANVHACVDAVELEPYHPLGLAKGERIGRPPQYRRSEFLEQNALTGALEQMRTLTAKPVRFG